MGADLEAPIAASGDGVRKDVVPVSPIHPGERPIVNRLNAVLDRQVGAPRDFLKQVQDVVGDAVGARAHGDSDDLRVQQDPFIGRAARETGAYVFVAGWK